MGSAMLHGIQILKKSLNELEYGKERIQMLGLRTVALRV
jgi:hypothetical protein